MDGLRTFAVLLMVVLTQTSDRTGHAAHGQSPGVPAATAPEAVFAVIGDVRHCNTYALNPQQRMTVREAVLQAGLVAESVNVSVIHRGQNQAQWSQLISLNSPETGELVAPGDVLQVRALSGTTDQVQPNAVLRTSDALVVVALADDQVAVGDILVQTGRNPETLGGVSIPCRLRGRASQSQVALSDRVAHGDLISVCEASGDNPGRRRGFSPQVSEWPLASEKPAPPAGTGTPGLVSLEVPREDLSGPSSATAVFEDSGNPAVSGPSPQVVTAPGDESPSTVTSDSDGLPSPAEPREPDTPGWSGGLKTTAEWSAPVSPENSSENAVQTAANAMRTVGYSNSVVPGDVNNVAPAPPEEVRLPVDDRPRLTPMNLTLIGGLLIAGTLILAGSFRVDSSPQAGVTTGIGGTNVHQLPNAEAPDLRQAAAATFHGETLRSGPAQQSDTTRDAEAPVPEGLQRQEIPALGATGPAAPSSGTPGLGDLVVASEWFSGEWLNTPASPRVPTLEPAAEQVMPLEAAVKQETVAELQTVAAERTAPVLLSDKTGSTGRDQTLEDLLHNRLRLDQQPLELPVRMTLFGRPTGPRHLRIDSPHAVLPGSHFALAAARQAGSATQTGSTTAVSNPETSGFAGTASSKRDRTDS